MRGQLGERAAIHRLVQFGQLARDHRGALRPEPGASSVKRGRNTVRRLEQHQRARLGRQPRQCARAARWTRAGRKPSNANRSVAVRRCSAPRSSPTRPEPRVPRCRPRRGAHQREAGIGQQRRARVAHQRDDLAGEQLLQQRLDARRFRCARAARPAAREPDRVEQLPACVAYPRPRSGRPRPAPRVRGCSGRARLPIGVATTSSLPGAGAARSEPYNSPFPSRSRLSRPSARRPRIQLARCRWRLPMLSDRPALAGRAGAGRVFGAAATVPAPRYRTARSTRPRRGVITRRPPRSMRHWPPRVPPQRGDIAAGGRARVARGGRRAEAARVLSRIIGAAEHRAESRALAAGRRDLAASPTAPGSVAEVRAIAAAARRLAPGGRSATTC